MFRVSIWPQGQLLQKQVSRDRSIDHHHSNFFNNIELQTNEYSIHLSRHFVGVIIKKKSNFELL